ncbi:hypothetical protein BSKO_10844 [Bryopsis sp. KO-2023]|nr:hypothetical protein BSKO_10844 [Bryopsis sp. KO-2023]
MGEPTLFDPVKVGSAALKHRVAMSAMTRTRCYYRTGVVSEIVQEYYEQRASDGGLLVSEGVALCPMAVCYLRAPGIWTDDQVASWKPLIERVHKKGSTIFCQLMYTGRVTHKSLLPNNRLPPAPSAVKPNGQHHIEGGKAEYDTPHALTLDEIPGVIEEFVFAAKRAMEAGFDGIELHGGNGYLLQEFLSPVTNLRTDAYGGSVEKRCKFVLELIDACVAAIGKDKVAIKLQPGVTFSDLVEPEQAVVDQLEYLGPVLETRELAYVCLSSLNTEPYCFFAKLSGPNVKFDVFQKFRKHYKGRLMVNGAISVEMAKKYVAEGTADLVSFGVLFLANPNLPELIKAGKELNQGGMNVKVWYGRETDPLNENDAEGYTDWPIVSA